MTPCRRREHGREHRIPYNWMDLSTEASNGHLVLRTTPHRRENVPIDGQIDKWAYWFRRAELWHKEKNAMLSSAWIIPTAYTHYLFHIRCRWVSPQESTGELTFNARFDGTDEGGRSTRFPLVYDLAWQAEQWVIRPKSSGDEWQSFNTTWMMDVLSQFLQQYSPHRADAMYVFDRADLFKDSKHGPRPRISWQRRWQQFFGLGMRAQTPGDNER